MYIYVNGKIKHSLIECFAETTLEGYVYLLSTVKTAKNTATNYLNCKSKLLKMKKLKLFAILQKKEPTCCKQNTRSETLVHDKPFM